MQVGCGEQGVGVCVCVATNICRYCNIHHNAPQTTVQILNDIFVFFFFTQQTKQTQYECAMLNSRKATENKIGAINRTHQKKKTQLPCCLAKSNNTNSQVGCHFFCCSCTSIDWCHCCCATKSILNEISFSNTRLNLGLINSAQTFVTGGW